MNYKTILYYLSAVFLIVSAFLIPPIAIALFRGETRSLFAFLITFVVMVGLGLPALIKRKEKKNLYVREGFVVVAMSWLLLSAVGALPLNLSGAVPNYIDCLFEIASGFTTTGSSVINDVEILPKSILYWRSFTHWLGGMGVLVFLLAISPSSSGDAFRLMRAESPGPEVTKFVPKTKKSAVILYEIYLGITVLLFVFLLCGGVNAFDALLLTFGTVGTGGFGVKNNSLVSYSPFVQWTIAIFMILCGINFGLYYLILQKQFKKALRNEELHVFLTLVLVSTGIFCVSILNDFNGNFGEALRHSVFQVGALISSTGFMTVDFNLWSPLCKTVILLLMLIGASAGSTGGGLKVSRIILMFKGIRAQIHSLLHPNAVIRVRMDKEVVSMSTVGMVFAHLCAYAGIAVISIILISFNGFSVESNISVVISCLSNIGPGLDTFGPTSTFAAFSSFSKIVLTLDMIIGRLEIFPILILLFPSTWKKSRKL